MLVLDEVRKRFGQTVAVDGLSLRIDAGEIFGLLGPNGAGKTTTIAISVGLLRPDSGRVSLGDLGSPCDSAVRRHLGICPQSIALYEPLTARENLRFFARINGGGASRARVDAVLGMVGLSDRADHRVSTYSGGMKRRLNLGAAIVHDPPLLLLDEPTAGVDPQSRHAIFDIVRSLREQGKTVVYTTHYMEEAQRLCDRVGIIDHGALLAMDTVDALIEAHGGRTVLTVDRADGPAVIETDDPVAELSNLELAKEGAGGDRVLGVRIDRPDLERVFLHLTGRTLRD